MLRPFGLSVPSSKNKPQLLILSAGVITAAAFETTDKIIAPAGFWPRGQNPRRHYSLPPPPPRIRIKNV